MEDRLVRELFARLPKSSLIISKLMIDLAIRNGWIIDGTRKERFRADIGVVGEKIVEIGRVPPALNEIDAGGPSGSNHLLYWAEIYC